MFLHRTFRCTYRGLTHANPLSFKPRSTSRALLIHTGVTTLLKKTLSKTQPHFPINSGDVKVLHLPDQFFRTLIEMIQRAKQTIHLSSLYIGSSEHELLEALRSSLANNPKLQVHIQLDYNRSTRPGKTSTAQLLVPLLRSFPDRIHVHLYRTPKLKGLMAKLVPRRFDEGWGTWHAKIYAADDEFLISGANLNSSYFTDRQDRYIHFRSQPHLRNYLSSFLDLFAQFSYSLRPSSASDNQPYQLQWTNKNARPHHFEAEARDAIIQFQQSMLKPLSEGQDTVIFPIIQAGVLGVREEEQVLPVIFDHAESGSTVDLTSGYFALYEPYQRHILSSPIRNNAWKIVAASPSANGFLGSKGVSGRIPEGYTLLEQRFWSKVLASERQWDSQTGNGVELAEWQRQGWTYHAKGIWLTPPNAVNPVATLLGSTNLNSRSANLDAELSFVMVTSSPQLQESLGHEVKHIRQHVKTVGKQQWAEQDRHVSLGTRTLVRMVGSMM